MLSVSGVNSKPLNFGSVYELSKAPKVLRGTVHIFTHLAASDLRYVADGAEGKLLADIHSACASEELKSNASAAKTQLSLINAYIDAKTFVLSKLGK